MSKSIVAIVGRPNVGKSTLFNRLVGRRNAIVADLPGTTRDRLYADVSVRGRDLTIVDMGGLEFVEGDSINKKVKLQIEVAIEEADVILFLVNAHDGILADDWEVANVLRRTRKPVALVVNKVDIARHKSETYQFFELGMSDPIPISAYHNRGVDELMDQIVEWIPLSSISNTSSELMKIAIVGRPNVGKSMMLNAILGEDRAVVDNVPGTTRDALDTIYQYNDEKIVFIDTAGIRRSGKIEQGIEKFSKLRGLQAIERADIALLVIDASEGLVAQDTHILGYVKDEYKGCLLIVNKWDLVEEQNEKLWKAMIRNKLRFMSYVSVVFTAANTGYNVDKIIPAAKNIYDERHKTISLTELDSVVNQAVLAHAPPEKGKNHIKVKRVVQVGVNPPVFDFFVANVNALHFTYQRYLENTIRKSFGFEGTPIRLNFKAGRNKSPKEKK